MRVRSSAKNRWEILGPKYLIEIESQIKNVHFMVDSSGEHFHAKDKDIGVDGVTLPNSSSNLKKLVFPPLTKTGGYTGHDESDKVFGEIEEEKGKSDE